MFLLLLLQITYALNLTTSPLPTAGVIQSWTPNISHSAMPSQTSQSFSSQLSTETPTNFPQYTDSPSSVQTQIPASPSQTHISASPSQTQTSTSASQQQSSQVSIYDTVTFKAGVGVSVGVLLIAIIICMKPTRPSTPVHPPFIAQTNPVTSIQKPLHVDIVTGKLLADGWKSTTDETGDVWYVNSGTGESSWIAKYKD